MKKITIQQLLDTGAHFGHLTRKWHPKMEPYIFMEKNSIHLIDLNKTKSQIEAAVNMIAKSVVDGGTILFVGTKKQAKDLVRTEAERCGMYYVAERWLGGTLTNFSTIRKSIKKLEKIEEEGASAYDGLTKKEVLTLERKRVKLDKVFRGIKAMKRLPDMIVMVDAKFEDTAVKEANKLDIPIIALVDTDTDPSNIDHVIPANDDSLRTVSLVLQSLADSVVESLEVRRNKLEAETSEIEVEQK
ncbi:MAG: 30S ribosomal protein S2 [Candidatus Marinimicrobia bacterium]|nr:30S ribosomal protein S2 [Candidatus Neomarinimicrobiota bacterium]MCH7954424.1 30S ribosomal protein S2 [Candidatus Neomarinimicrobiota bacterium]